MLRMLSLVSLMLVFGCDTRKAEVISPSKKQEPITREEDHVRYENHDGPPIVYSASGIEIGDTPSVEWIESHCSGYLPLDGFRTCTEFIGVEGERTEISYRFVDGKLRTVSLKFDAVCYRMLVDSYSKKFGVKPHEHRIEITKEPVLGHTYFDSVTWKATNGQFFLSYHGKCGGFLATEDLPPTEQEKELQRKRTEEELSKKL